MLIFLVTSVMKFLKILSNLAGIKTTDTDQENIQKSKQVVKFVEK